VKLALLPDWLSAEGLFEILGPWALIGFTIIIFLECGLFIGILFPGDSLLFLTGMLVASGAIDQPLWLVISLLFSAAVLGNIVGYHVGNYFGPKLFTNPNSRLLKPEYVEKTHVFFEKYGAKAIILARFVPIVRTLITATAGVAGMDRKKFYLYSLVGAIIWAIGVTLLGYWLGQIDIVKNNIEIALLLLVLVSTIPVIIEAIRHRKESKS
jgi:membrane-associated protein